MHARYPACHVEGARSLISGCSAGFLDYGFAPLEMTKILL